MKTFKFAKQTTEKIVKAFNVQRCANINDIMALSTIQKCYGIDCKIRVFHTYIDKITYVYYEKDGKILPFGNEKEAYEFILNL